MPNNIPYYHSRFVHGLERFETESGGESDFPPIRRHTYSPEAAHGSGIHRLQFNPEHLNRQDSTNGDAQPPPYTQACLIHQVPAITGSIAGLVNNENQPPQTLAVQPQPHHPRQENAPRVVFREGLPININAPPPNLPRPDSDADERPFKRRRVANGRERNAKADGMVRIVESLDKMAAEAREDRREICDALKRLISKLDGEN